MYVLNIFCEVVVVISVVALVVFYHCSALSVDIQKRFIRVNLIFSEVFQVIGVFCAGQIVRNLDNDSHKLILA